MASMAVLTEVIGMEKDSSGGWATNVPMPWRVSTRPLACSRDMASRTTVRLTPNCCMSSDSVGSLSPGCSVPALMSAVSASTASCAKVREERRRRVGSGVAEALMTVTRPGGSESNGRLEGATLEVRAQVVHDQLRHGMTCFRGAACMMWVQDYVFQFKKARIDIGFVLENIQGGAGDTALLQGLDESVLVDDRAPRQVDDPRFGAQGFKHACVDQVTRLWAAGTSHCQDVNVRRRVGQPFMEHIRYVLLAAAGIGVLHLERSGAVGELVAGPPQAYDV